MNGAFKEAGERVAVFEDVDLRVFSAACAYPYTGGYDAAKAEMKYDQGSKLSVSSW